jgi:acetyltransferase-like isoleucine patch superfamily enzyme
VIEAARPHAVVAFIDELSADRSLLEAWSRTFTGGDPVTLVIHPGDWSAEQVSTRVATIVESAGIPDEPDAVHLMALTGPLSDADDRLLAERCAAVYGPQPASGELGSLPQVRPDQLVDLRGRLRAAALAGGVHAEDRREPEPPDPQLTGDAYNGWHDPNRITMGRHSYGSPTVLTYLPHGTERVEVGSFCSIAAGVSFLLDGQHRVDFVTTSPFGGMGFGNPPGHGCGKGSITVGHDVWIGREAKILSGVTIATGAVVGAYSVVTKDVRPYAIVGGNPAREIRRRFSDEDCELLLASRWWEWPDERIAQAIDDLWSTDIRGFVARWG